MKDREFVRRRATWLWAALILFGLLDGRTLVRHMPNSFEIAYGHLRGGLHGSPPWNEALHVLRAPFILSVAATCAGFVLAYRWAFVLSYVQLPFRVVYMLFTFGVAATPIAGTGAPYGTLGIAMALEITRLVLTIVAHVRLQRWGQLAVPKPGPRTSEEFR